MNNYVSPYWREINCLRPICPFVHHKNCTPRSSDNLIGEFLQNLHACLLPYLESNIKQCNPTPEFSWHPTKIYGPKIFMLTKIKPEYSNILYNTTHFLCPLVCWIRQVPLYNILRGPFLRCYCVFDLEYFIKMGRG